MFEVFDKTETETYHIRKNPIFYDTKKGAYRASLVRHSSYCTVKFVVLASVSLALFGGLGLLRKI